MVVSGADGTGAGAATLYLRTGVHCIYSLRGRQLSRVTCQRYTIHIPQLAVLGACVGGAAAPVLHLLQFCVAGSSRGGAAMSIVHVWPEHAMSLLPPGLANGVLLRSEVHCGTGQPENLS